MFTNTTPYKYYCLCLCFSFLVTGCNNVTNTINNSQNELEIEIEEGERKPSDYFFMQRAYPHGNDNHQAYLMALKKSAEMKREKREKQEKRTHGLKSINDNAWQAAGPYNVGGRITDVEMHPGDIETIYACAASGGIFKSIDQGETWTAIFDEQSSLSIGDMAIANTDADILYVGTGEANAGGGSLAYDGTGVFKSDDGGDSWQYLGLEAIRNVGKVVIDPFDENTVFVAGMGELFANNSERGIYKTTDGGETWDQSLYVSDSTGGIDLAIHPYNSDTVYACMWERVRRPQYRKYGGETCGVYRTVDGGENWEKLTNGLPTTDVGRIGIAISNSEPNILYVVMADEFGYFKGLYRSNNNGEDWIDAYDDNLFDNYFYWSFGWWFGKIEVDPTDPDIVYAMGLNMYKTTNGGSSWTAISSNGYPLHYDQHSIYIHPQDHNFVVVGNDGGVYTSNNAGAVWNHKNKLAITQFYTCEIDFQNPERLYGGAQDNGTNRTMTGSTDDWEHIYGGDGFIVRVDPENPQYVYTEYQYGNFARSSNGGSSFAPLNLPSGRYNWQTPYVLEPGNPSTIYLGNHRVQKSTNRGSSWSPISSDLTNGDPNTNLVFGTLTTIGISAINTEILYAGTDDGNVWNTTDGGDSWEDVSADLPNRWVTNVVAHPTEELSAFVTFSGYRYNDYLSHVYKTENAGENWVDVSGNLPEVPVNDLIVDPTYPDTLIVATDVGVFITFDEGQEWEILGDSLPNVPVNDLTFHAPTRKLAAATYGRSMFTYALDTIASIIDTTDNPIDTTDNPIDTTIVIIDTTDNPIDTTIVIVDTTDNPMDTDVVAIQVPQLSLLNFNVYPNPIVDANPQISFELSESQQVNITVMDMNGQVKAILVDAFLQIGKHQFIVDLNQERQTFQTGMYLLNLYTQNGVLSKKIVVLD